MLLTWKKPESSDPAVSLNPELGKLAWLIVPAPLSCKLFALVTWNVKFLTVKLSLPADTASASALAEPSVDIVPVTLPSWESGLIVTLGRPTCLNGIIKYPLASIEDPPPSAVVLIISPELGITLTIQSIDAPPAAISVKPPIVALPPVIGPPGGVSSGSISTLGSKAVGLYIIGSV